MRAVFPCGQSQTDAGIAQELGDAFEHSPLGNSQTHSIRIENHNPSSSTDATCRDRSLRAKKNAGKQPASEDLVGNVQSAPRRRTARCVMMMMVDVMDELNLANITRFSLAPMQDADKKILDQVSS